MNISSLGGAGGALGLAWGLGNRKEDGSLLGNTARTLGMGALGMTAGVMGGGAFGAAKAYKRGGGKMASRYATTYANRAFNAIPSTLSKAASFF